MKKIILTTLLTLFIAVFCYSQVKVKGYYRKDGTYVQSHYRSKPDGNPYNNYSYLGNTNPYTGTTASGNSSTYLNNYTNRIYLKNSSGNNTMYVVPVYKKGKKSIYSTYSLSDNHTGTLVMYKNGDYYMYDNRSNLLDYKTK